MIPELTTMIPDRVMHCLAIDGASGHDGASGNFGACNRLLIISYLATDSLFANRSESLLQ